MVAAGEGAWGGFGALSRVWFYLARGFISCTAQDRPTLFFEVIERHGVEDSGSEISKPCSSVSNANRRQEGICRKFVHNFYNQ